MAAYRAVLFTCTLSLMLFVGDKTVAQVASKARVIISADVALVQVPAIVFNAQGAVSADLRATDFRLFENGLEQRVLYFERERQPVSFVILDDVSQSMTNKIAFVRDATAAILSPPSPPNPYRDEYSIFGIESHVNRIMSF